MGLEANERRVIWNWNLFGESLPGASYFRSSQASKHVSLYGAGGNEYGQCGEEPEKKDDTGRPPRRDIAIPQRCAPKLIVRQVTYF